MPYIHPHDRGRLLDALHELQPLTLGELNFVITKLLLRFIARDPHAVGYATYASVIGVLETCKLEFYRRAIVPYEAQKIDENGDVF